MFHRQERLAAFRCCSCCSSRGVQDLGKSYVHNLCYSRIHWKLTPSLEETPVLKSTVFQDFELKEKTIISHNVAMFVLCHLALTSFSNISTAIDSVCQNLLQFSVSLSVNISLSLLSFPNPTEKARKSFDPIPLFLAITNQVTSTSSSSPTLPETSLNTWLLLSLVKLSKFAVPKAQWYIHPIWFATLV